MLQILKKSIVLECKCHGPSGSCALKTCWMSLPPIRQVSDRLMSRYYKAKKVLSVQLRKQKTQSLKLYRSKRNSQKTPKKGDLVFLDESPNYCEYSPGDGAMGTVGRFCNKTSTESDSCDNLCCGRGHDSYEYERTWQCDCKFHWCCHVTCNECKERIKVQTCK